MLFGGTRKRKCLWFTCGHAYWVAVEFLWFPESARGPALLFFGDGIAPGWGPLRGFVATKGFFPSNKWFIAVEALETPVVTFFPGSPFWSAAVKKYIFKYVM